MNFLKKILLIVVISLSAESMGAVFDLPTETPGLQNGGATLVHPHNGIQCIKVTVNGHDIYFPADGTQPTTPDTVNYSLANVDNSENSPITEWYMMMFGVISINNSIISMMAGGDKTPYPVYVQAGWSHPAPGSGAINAQRIISFPVARNGFLQIDATQDCVDPNVPGINVSIFTLFERKFRKIASTSVGRVLLYRILIETRRHKNGNSTGCQEESIPLNIPRTRNLHRSIYIYGCPTRGGFSPDDGFIVFRMKPAKIYLVIGKKNAMGYTHIQYSEASLDISLFHEMLHWYHALRDTDRSTMESNYDKRYSLNNHRFGNYYWKGFDLNDSEKRRISERSWKVKRTNSMSEKYYPIDFEEMRTILGEPNIEKKLEYREGDDLSENLYRLCLGSPLCFGYNTDFYEDNKVVENVILYCVQNYASYIKMDDISIEYNDSQLKQGLGRNKTRP